MRRPKPPKLKKPSKRVEPTKSELKKANKLEPVQTTVKPKKKRNLYD